MMSLRTHGTLDYTYALGLMLSPFFFGFASLDVARNVFTLTGIMIALYSLFTNYHAAVLRVIPLGVHMTLDLVAGAFLIGAPWVFGYQGLLTPTQEVVHYAVGVGAWALVGVTRERTELGKRAHHVRVRPMSAGSNA